MQKKTPNHNEDCKETTQLRVIFFKWKNCSNTRELHSYMDIFFLSKLVTAADKPLDVSSVFLPFSARPDHIQKPISCISSHLVGWKMTP